jgi:membrane protein YqaA with SNARE-associated domain
VTITNVLADQFGEFDASRGSGPSLTQEHPLGAIFAGVGILVAAVVWLRLSIPYDRLILRTVFRWMPGRERQEERLNSRWYRYVSVYFGALFLAIVGVVTIVAGIVNMVG